MEHYDIGTMRPAVYGINELEQDAAAGCEQIQQQVLRGILLLHEKTEYLQRYNLGPTSTAEDFKALHPVCDYPHFREWVEREASGEAERTSNQILCAEKIFQFLLSSGTTSGRKLIPETVGSMTRSVRFGQLTKTLIQRHFGAESTDHSLRLVNCSAPQILPGGLPAIPIVTGLINLALKYDLPRVLREDCSPPEVYTHTLHDEASYCHVLCALAARGKLTALRTTFAVTLVTALTDLELNWAQFMHDIRTGTVSEERISSAVVRDAVARRIGANPGLADALEAEFREGFEGIVPRIWPRVKFVECIFTGPMTGYVAPLRRFTGPDLPLVSLTYACSESLVGVNVDLRDEPSSVRYTLLPREAFWEFIPVDESDVDGQTGNRSVEDGTAFVGESGSRWAETDDDLGRGAGKQSGGERESKAQSNGNGTDCHGNANGSADEATSENGSITGETESSENPIGVACVKTVGMHELELGRCYEVVLTNWAGLYRYRLEDVIKVEGFLQSLPQVSFQYRRGVLSIQGATEHMTEKDLTGAVLETAEGLALTGRQLVEYTTAVDTGCVPPRYTVFAEIVRLRKDASDNVKLDLESLAASLDAALSRRNSLYENSIKKHELSPLEVCLVKPSTFEELFRYRVKEHGIDAGQYKVPRCIKSQELREIFKRATIGSSLAVSHWCERQ
ncbi:indole-3-acetic acid-amido synthetase -like [Klebsormidium nitens]|uniref:Indole-3-acetic acid-amido synthetase-like n=1 Tax=Klebsormidium nitens TaxID=105231 RepID=A0A0U9HTE9_KLENI|nr:indole-3-acetic acid-amido synthetase -like [Klebsormidium nitens]|eukprot:GAQ77955.1 indole-3-acetic acid-amido synthetase -like [Klebsormidium nitens]